MNENCWQFGGKYKRTRGTEPLEPPGFSGRKATLCLRGCYRFYHGHKGCGWEARSRMGRTSEDSQNKRRLLFYGRTFFIRPGTTNTRIPWIPFLFFLSPYRSCWTQCTDISPGSIWSDWAMARAYPATPRSCRIWTIKPSFSRRPCSRPWRPIRINWLRNWKSIRIRLRKDFAIRLVSPTLIGKCCRPFCTSTCVVGPVFFSLFYDIMSDLWPNLRWPVEP